MTRKRLEKIFLLLVVIFMSFGCEEWKKALDELSPEKRALINEFSCSYKSSNLVLTNGTIEPITLTYYIQNDEPYIKANYANQTVPAGAINLLKASDLVVSTSPKVTINANNSFKNAFANYFVKNNSCMNFSAKATAKKNGNITVKLVTSGGNLPFNAVSSNVLPTNATPTSESSKTFYNNYTGNSDTITFSVIEGNKYVQLNEASKVKYTGEEITFRDDGNSYLFSKDTLDGVFANDKASNTFYLARNENRGIFVITTNPDEFPITYQTTNSADPSGGSSSGDGSGSNGSQGNTTIEGSQSKGDCSGLLGNGEFKKILTGAFDIMRMLGVGLVLILTIIDFAGAILGKNEDDMKKAAGKVVTRIILALALFFLPFILGWVLSLIDGMGTVCV